MSEPISLPVLPMQTITLTNGIEKLRSSLHPEKIPSTAQNDHQLEGACSEFESLFIYYLLKEMRATIPKSGFLDGGNAQEFYTSMLDSQLARDLSSKGGIGLSSILLDQLRSKGKPGDEENHEK
jgi:flagellar protein FlgJ